MTNDQLLSRFLDTWPLERVGNMTLEEYNKQGSKDTFCYMLEYGTKSLANIGGMAGAAKFEVYQRKETARLPKGDFYSDDQYTWRKRAGKTREEAFRYTKNIIVDVVEAALAGDFKRVDGQKLAPLVVWKIAFIYSDKQILSVSDRKAVRTMAHYFGHKTANKVRLSALHEYLMHRVSRESYWEDMESLWKLYRGHQSLETETETVALKSRKRPKGTTLKDVEDSIVKLGARQFVVTKKHNILQQEIYERLVAKYGKEHVSMEEGYVDLRVEHQDRTDYYEVKIASSAMYCIREALGQLLEYSYKHDTDKDKRLIIVGNHNLDGSVVSYLGYLNQRFIDVELQYIPADKAIP